MQRPATVELRHPLRIVRSRAPWRALIYLLLEALAGVVTIGVWFTVLLIPVWLLAWPRTESRLLPLADTPRPRTDRGRWSMRWQDVVLVLLTPAMAFGVFVLGTLVVTVLGSLFSVPVMVIIGRDIRVTSAGAPLPAVPMAILSPVLGILVLILVLWGLTALAFGWATINSALLRDEEGRLAAQVDALSDRSVRVGDEFDLERRALERDLHDGAQMHLSAAGMRLALAQLDVEQLVEGPDRERLLTELCDARVQLDLGVQAVRDAASGLVPSSLRDGGLDAALRELAEALPLVVRLTCDVPRLPGVLERSVHLMAQEALTNVARHSRAATVTVDCRILDAEDTTDAKEQILLEVADDGIGGAGPTGTGIVGIRARARSLGGRLHLSSPEGEGTVVTVHVPVPEHDEVRSR